MLALALVSMLAAAPPDLSDEAKKELKALEGDWTVVSIASDGMEREAKADEQVAVTVKDTKFTFGKFGDGEVIAHRPDYETEARGLQNAPEAGVRLHQRSDFQSRKGYVDRRCLCRRGCETPDKFRCPE